MATVVSCWLDLQRLMNLLDRALNAGGEDWTLQSLATSRWAPPEGSDLERDLRMLMVRATPPPDSSEVTVDWAMQLLERDLFSSPLLAREPEEVQPEAVPTPSSGGESGEPGEGEPGECEAGEGEGQPGEGDGEASAEEALALAMLLAPPLGGESSDQAGEGDGGWNNEAEEDALPTADLRRLEAVFQRFLRATAPGLEEEGRVNWGGFTSRLVSRQGGLNRDRRLERGPGKGVAFLPDISGSCAGISSLTLSVCWRIARQYDRFVVLPHSNGVFSVDDTVYPEDVPCPSPTDLHNPTQDWVPLLKAAEVEWVVALGDWDASDLYGALAAAGFKVLWVDPRRGAGARARNADAGKALPRDAGSDAAARLSYWEGASSVRTLTEAVEAGFKALSGAPSAGV
jgi:hypothetical protein